MDAPALPSFFEMRAKTQDVFEKRLCLFQLQLCLDQLQGKDIISIAVTGSGKTLAFLMPLPFNGGKIIIIITALNVLGTQFVNDAIASGFSAISVTA